MRALQTFLKFGLVTTLLLIACGDKEPSFAIDESKIISLLCSFITANF